MFLRYDFKRKTYFHFRLGSGKPQNLIIDDGKESDEDETFVVEEPAPPPIEQEQVM